MRLPFRLAVAVSACTWLGAVVLTAQLPAHPSLLRNHPAISYVSTPVSDPVSRLNERLRRGDTTLAFNQVNGFLPSVLAALDVPVESQVLVFSKTSFQAPKIGPDNPRALYFNDAVSVGFVRGSDLLEFVSEDPRQGAVFFTLKQSPEGTPQFERNDTCVMCHAFEGTHFVPGMFVGSVFPGPDGTAMYGPTFTTDHRSLFERRWGGWFVTGTHHGAAHMGNAVVTNPRDLEAMITPETVHVTSLAGRFDPAGYLTLHSDIVALLVLEHQAQMLNLMTRIGWESRIGDEAGRPLTAAAAELVDYLLFVDEPELPGPIAGSAGFAARFQARGPRDRRGRSLRDLDLQRRLMRYPCSYLIYSDVFEALPPDATSAVYARMWEVLSGADGSARYARLTPADRTAIVEILHDTRSGLPDYFDPRLVRGQGEPRVPGV